MSSLSSRPYRAVGLASRYAPALGAFDMKRAELADQIAKMIAPSRGILVNPQAETLGVLSCKRVKQVSYREKCETKNGT